MSGRGRVSVEVGGRRWSAPMPPDGVLAVVAFLRWHSESDGLVARHLRAALLVASDGGDGLRWARQAWIGPGSDAAQDALNRARSVGMALADALGVPWVGVRDRLRYDVEPGRRVERWALRLPRSPGDP